MTDLLLSTLDYCANESDKKLNRMVYNFLRRTPDWMSIAEIMTGDDKFEHYDYDDFVHTMVALMYQDAIHHKVKNGIHYFYVECGPNNYK